jgi:hypothetical protein
MSAGEQMAGLIGRRGDILWRKNKFVGGGGRRDYDCYLGWEFIVPLYPVRLVHTFGWEESRSSARAIPLREDRRFKTKAMVDGWCAPIFVLSAVAVLLFCCSGFSWPLTIISVVVLAASGACMLVFKGAKGTRDRDIRLVLGPHTWGSSDPATWHKRLLKKVVDPLEDLEVESFGALAEELIEKRTWVDAMWAARLCVAVEDEAMGEQLTDEILSRPKVADKLRWLRKAPWERREVFDDAPPLSDWVRGDLKAAIFKVNG